MCVCPVVEQVLLCSKRVRVSIPSPCLNTAAPVHPLSRTHPSKPLLPSPWSTHSLLLSLLLTHPPIHSPTATLTNTHPLPLSLLLTNPPTHPLLLTINHSLTRNSPSSGAIGVTTSLSGSSASCRHSSGATLRMMDNTMPTIFLCVCVCVHTNTHLHAYTHTNTYWTVRRLVSAESIRHSL